MMTALSDKKDVRGGVTVAPTIPDKKKLVKAIKSSGLFTKFSTGEWKLALVQNGKRGSSRPRNIVYIDLNGKELGSVSKSFESTHPEIDHAKALKAGEAWSTAEFCEKAAMRRQSLKLRRDSFTIVYWTDAKGHCFYPTWQFDQNLQVKPKVRQILGILRTHDTLFVLNKFLSPAIGDEGLSVLDLINLGRGDEAVEYVRQSENDR